MQPVAAGSYQFSVVEHELRIRVHRDHRARPLDRAIREIAPSEDGVLLARVPKPRPRKAPTEGPKRRLRDFPDAGPVRTKAIDQGS